MAEKEKIKGHKETLQETLYTKDFYTSTDEWKEYPKSRIKCDYITYTWEYLDKNDIYQKYAWDKVVVKISKLVIVDWNTEIAKKSYVSKNWEAYSKNDTKEVSFSVDEFEDFVSNVNLNFDKKK